MSFFDSKAASLEDQLTNLARCGIKLRPGVSLSELLRAFGRDQFEGSRYTLLLVVMGAEEPLSDDIWHLDTECIEGPGSYVTVAKRLRLLAKGGLPIEHLADRVSDEEAWLSFRLHGREYRWQAQMDDDWLDGRILSAFAHLLDRENTGRRFTYSNLEGQDCLIGCATPAELEELNRLGGPQFVWLS